MAVRVAKADLQKKMLMGATIAVWNGPLPPGPPGDLGSAAQSMSTCTDRPVPQISGCTSGSRGGGE